MLAYQILDCSINSILLRYHEGCTSKQGPMACTHGPGLMLFCPEHLCQWFYAENVAVNSLQACTVGKVSAKANILEGKLEGLVALLPNEHISPCIESSNMYAYVGPRGHRPTLLATHNC